MKTFVAISALLGLAIPCVRAHAAFIHPSTWGFNVTSGDYPYDNRPVAPLTKYPFSKWWFHGHLDHPPKDGDVFELPAGGVTTAEIACHMGATSFWESAQENGDGGDLRTPANPNDVCPGSGMDEYHTTGPDDLKGCVLAIAYKDDVNQVQPEDFTVFSVNHTCVFNRFTDFSVPAQMPPCPAGGCTCAWMWIHSPDSGGEQNYMNGFKCNVTGSTSSVALATPQVPRRCGVDLNNAVDHATPGNCTWGAKNPFYWFQAERNNMFEGEYSPPEYTDMYNFANGAQNDIFQNSYQLPLPVPGPNQTEVPTFLSGERNSTNSLGKRVDNAAKFLEVKVTTVTATATVVASSSVASSSSIALTTSASASASLSTSAADLSVPTSTIFHTVYVTATATVHASSTDASSIATATPSFVPVSASAASLAPAPSSALSAIKSVYTSVYPISTIKLVAASSAPASTSTSAVSARPSVAQFAAAAGSNVGCKAAHGLGAAGGIAGVQRRSLSSFHATGSFKRRKMTDRASLWRIF